MCEPFQSIVQYPNQDDDQNPTGNLIDAAAQNLKKSSGGMLGWIKKIFGFTHFSRFGAGHSGATPFNTYQQARLPEPTSYETMWWNRKVHADGEYSGVVHDKRLALEAATEYANRTSIGNLSTLRGFLEASMKNSERPEGYLVRFYNQLLNVKGQSEMQSKLQRFFGMDTDNMRMLLSDWSSSLSRSAMSELLIAQQHKNGMNFTKLDLINRLLNMSMGLTRKRDLLVPEWADDAKLWVPNGC